jgi:hypothetical protein
LTVLIACIEVPAQNTPIPPEVVTAFSMTATATLWTPTPTATPAPATSAIRGLLDDALKVDELSRTIDAKFSVIRPLAKVDQPVDLSSRL